MARGWESKSVEAQIDMAQEHHHSAGPRTPDPAELEIVRRRETILLSRVRVVRELESAQNPRYKLVLNKALADLDAQLSNLACH
jgi:hypothetical protein